MDGTSFEDAGGWLFGCDVVECSLLLMADVAHDDMAAGMMWHLEVLVMWC